MDAFIASGRVADVVLIVLGLEAAVLIVFARRARGFSLFEIAAALAPGACLVLALRAALTDQAWPGIAAWLTAAFAAHTADLWLRWRRG